MNQIDKNHNGSNGLNFVPRDTFYEERRDISYKAGIIGAALKTADNGSLFDKIWGGTSWALGGVRKMADATFGGIYDAAETIGYKIGESAHSTDGKAKTNPSTQPKQQQVAQQTGRASMQQLKDTFQKPNPLMNNLTDMARALQKGDNIFHYIQNVVPPTQPDALKNFIGQYNKKPGSAVSQTTPIPTTTQGQPDALHGFFEQYNKKQEHTASGEAFSKGFLSQVGLGLASPKSVEYEPKTFSDKVWYTAGTTLGMVAGAAATGGLIDLIPELAAGTSVGKAIDAAKALNASSIGRLSRYLDSSSAQKLIEVIAGKDGLESYWNGAVRLATELGLQRQLTLPANTSLRERTIEGAKAGASAFLFSRMGIISNPFTRITAHAAYGTVSTLLDTGDPEMAAIQGVTFGAMGAMGGFPNNIDAMTRGLTNKARDVIKTIPETHESVAKIDSFVNDVRSGDSIKLDNTTQETPAAETKPTTKKSESKKTTKVSLKEAADSVKQIKESVNKESNRHLANLDVSKIINDYNKQNNLSIADVLSVNAEGDGIHQEIGDLFGGYSSGGVDEEDIAGTTIKGGEGSVNFDAQSVPRDEQILNEKAKQNVRDAIDAEISFQIKNQFPEMGDTDLPWMAPHHFERAGTDVSTELETSKAPQEQKNLNPPTVGQRATLEATARMIAHADPEFKSFIDEAKKVTTQHDVWATYHKMVGEFAAKVAGKSIDGDTDWLNNTHLGSPVDADKINKIVDLFKQSNGTKEDFAKALAESAGLKKTGFSWAPSANKVAKEFGYKTAADMYADWANKYKDVFGPIIKLQTAADLMNQRVLDAVSEHQNKVYKYVPDVSGVVDSIDPSKLKVEDGKAVSARPSEIKSREQIEAELNNLLGIQLKKGVRGKAEGTMYGNIMSLKDNDFGTYTHELGHNLDRLFNITGSILADAKTNSASSEMSKAIIQELIDNASPRVKKNYKPSDWVNESFADMVHNYFVNDGVATQYPLSYQYMRNAISAHEPALMEAIDQRVNDYKVFASSDLAAQVAASIDNDNTPGVIKQLGQDIKDRGVKQTLQNFKEGIKDTWRRQINIQSYGADLDKQAGLSGTKSLYHKFDVYFQKASGIKSWMFEMGTPTAESLQKILDTTPVDQLKNASRGYLDIWGDVKPDHRLSVESYLVIKRYEELIKSGAADKAKLPFEGLKDEASIKNALDTIRAKVPYVDDIANEIARSNADVIKMVAGKNYFDDDTLDKLINLDQQHPYYTSLVRMHNIFDDENPFNVRRNMSMFRRFSGSTRSDFVSPFVSGYSMRSSIVDSVMKTDMLRTLVHFAEGQEAVGKFDHQKLLYIVKNPPVRSTQMALEDYMKVLKDSGGFTREELAEQRAYWEQHQDELEKIYRPNVTMDKNIYRVRMEDGSIKYIYLDDVIRENFDSSKTDNLSDNPIMRGFRAYTSWKRQLTTSLSPVFIIKNPARDALEAFMNADKFFIPVYDQAKGLSHVLKKDNVYWTGRLYGLDQESITSMDVNSVKQHLVEYAPSDKGGLLDTYGPSAIFRRYVDALKNISSMSEAMTRFGVLRKYDLSKPEEIVKGIHDARQATINWNQHGLKDSALSRSNSYTAFLKANIIASAKPISVSVQHPIRTLARGSLLSALSFLVGAALWDKKDYWEQPVQNFMNAINLPIPKELQNEIPMLKGKTMRIPMFGNTWFATFFGLPQFAMQQMKMGGDKDLAGEWINQMIGNIVPMIPEEISNPKSVALDFLPDYGKSLGEMMLNQSQFSGLPLIPQSLQNRAPEFQYNAYTSQFSVALAKGLAQHYDIHISPIFIDQFMRDATFSLFDVGSSMTNAISQMAGINPNEQKQPFSASDLPIISQFIRSETSPSSFWPVSRLYNMYYSSKVTYDTYKALLKSNPAEAVQYYKDNMGDLEYIYPLTSSYLPQVKTQIESYKAIQNNKSLNADARDAKLQSIRNAITLYAYQLEDQLNHMNGLVSKQAEK